MLSPEDVFAFFESSSLQQVLVSFSSGPVVEHFEGLVLGAGGLMGRMESWQHRS